MTGGQFKSGPSGPDMKAWFESGGYGQFEEALHKKMADDLTRWAKDHMHTRQPEKIVNPNFKPTPKPRPAAVVIQENVTTYPHSYEVMMPNGYYLVNEDGYPINIGASYHGPSEFKSVDEALKKFVHVAETFKRLFP